MDPLLDLALTAFDGHVSHWPRYGAALDEFRKQKPLTVLGPALTTLFLLVLWQRMRWTQWPIHHVPAKTGL
jgi:hypothetical protein